MPIEYKVVTRIYPDPEKQGCLTAMVPPVILRAICQLFTSTARITYGHNPFTTIDQAQKYIDKQTDDPPGSYKARNGKYYVRKPPEIVEVKL
jgi:hypothetical protein